MALMTFFNICLCCRVYNPDDAKTVLKFSEYKKFEIVSFASGDGICTVIMKQEPANRSCPRRMFPVSKPALISQEISASIQPVIMTCQRLPKYDVLVARRRVYLTSPLKTGNRIVIIATPIDEKSIFIYLSTDSGDKPLVYTILFNSSKLQHVVARSSVKRKRVGTPRELSQSYFPYQLKRESNTTIMVHDTEYRIHVDGVHMFTFTFKLTDPSVTKITIIGKLIYKTIVIT